MVCFPLFSVMPVGLGLVALARVGFWFGWVCFGLASGLVGFGLGWPGVWSGLVWFGFGFDLDWLWVWFGFGRVGFRFGWV